MSIGGEIMALLCDEVPAFDAYEREEIVALEAKIDQLLDRPATGIGVQRPWRALAERLARAVKPFLDAAGATSSFWSDQRRMGSLSYSELTVGDLRSLARAVQTIIALERAP
jgi:hypothetical protein